MKLLVINGPNLNMLGTRERHIYGTKTLDNINEDIKSFCNEKGVDVKFFQSNHEGAIIDRLHEAAAEWDGVVINAGAYTHYSIAIADAIKAIDIPVIEVHMSNVQSREEYRHRSVIGAGCVGVVAGFGAYSYILAVMALINELNKKDA